ncbi:MAG: ABC transporter ATP-binding protein [Patescibacteria group bacterium]
MTVAEKLLQLEKTHVTYGGVKALAGVDIYVDENEIVALLGPNGAGKSTVLKAMFGLAPLAAGRVRWHGEEVKPVPYEMVGRGLAFVPQGRRVFHHLSVYENLEIGAYRVKEKNIVKSRIEEVIDIFPALRAKLSAKSGTLSGGQQQMLAIARGLMTDPKVLLLDEPSLGLSPKIVKEVFAKIKEINNRRQMAIVVVEHNLKSLLSIASRAYILSRGEVAAEGKPSDLTQGDLLERVFLGGTVSAR